jgi:hypothetical protein
MGTSPGCPYLDRETITFINQKKNDKVKFRKIKAGGRGCAAEKSNGDHLWRLRWVQLSFLPLHRKCRILDGILLF